MKALISALALTVTCFFATGSKAQTLYGYIYYDTAGSNLETVSRNLPQEASAFVYDLSWNRYVVKGLVARSVSMEPNVFAYTADAGISPEKPFKFDFYYRIKLPIWKQYSTQCQTVQRAWDEYYLALSRYENRHADEISKRLEGPTRKWEMEINAVEGHSGALATPDDAKKAAQNDANKKIEDLIAKAKTEIDGLEKKLKQDTTSGTDTNPHPKIDAGIICP